MNFHAEAEVPIFGPPNVESRLTEKDSETERLGAGREGGNRR